MNAKPMFTRRTRRKLAPQDSSGKAGLEHLLRERGVPYVAVDEAKKAIFAGSSLKAFDFLVYCDDGPNHLVLVVYGRPTAEQEALLGEWEKVFGPAFVTKCIGSGSLLHSAGIRRSRFRSAALPGRYP